MNLTEWARAQGISPHTAYRWFRYGTLPVPAVPVGPRTILVNIEANHGRVARRRLPPAVMPTPARPGVRDRSWFAYP